jgi:1-acyl-sn-glycerol-3-phosphate acyltransferase
MRGVLALMRLVRVLLCIAAGWWTLQWRFARMSLAQREQTVQAWAQRMLRAFGIEMQVQGESLQNGPVLWVANHISWLDILSLHAMGHCRFVAKAEVHRWPLIGQMAAASGTLFIERQSSRDALRVVHQMAQALKDGDVLAVFPEGTTSDGQGLLPFHANLLQAALATQAPVQPLYLRYTERASGLRATSVCYIGEQTLVGSIWRTLTAPEVQVSIRVGACQQANGRNRRQWAHDLRQAMLSLAE